MSVLIRRIARNWSARYEPQVNSVRTHSVRCTVSRRLSLAGRKGRLYGSNYPTAILAAFV